MSKKTTKKQTYTIDVIKTPDGQVPTVESFHKVIDGLFGEILDTRKDIAKLIPNLEQELANLREILAQQMVMFEIINNTIKALQKDIKNQEKRIGLVQKNVSEMIQANLSEVELTEESIKAITKIVQSNIKSETKPLSEALKKLRIDFEAANKATLTRVEKEFTNIRDQIEDLSSKTELQMLEILESINQKPIKSTTKTTTQKTTSTGAKKKLPS